MDTLLMLLLLWIKLRLFLTKYCNLLSGSVFTFMDINEVIREKNLVIPLLGAPGAIGLSLDSVMNFKKLKKIIPKEIALMGNLNPVKIFLQFTPDEVAESTRSLKDNMKDTDNFILSSGCDIPLNTPLENIEAFIKAARG